MGGFGSRVLPTKINLIRLRRELKSLRRIRKVLEEKRDVLLLYIRQMIKEYEEEYKKVSKLVMDAYKHYLLAVAETGFEPVREAALAIPPRTEVSIETKVLFAVKAPLLELVKESVPPFAASFARVSPRLRVARDEMLRGLEALIKLAEAEATLEKLLDELRETQRLLNALDYQIIPSVEQAIKYIRRVLDDRMREEIIRLKLLKRKLEKARQKEREQVLGEAEAARRAAVARAIAASPQAPAS